MTEQSGRERETTNVDESMKKKKRNNNNTDWKTCGAVSVIAKTFGLFIYLFYDL